VQGDIPDAWRTSLASLPAVLARYQALIGGAARDRPALVVLPENAAGVSPVTNPQVLARLAAPLDGPEARLLLGAPRTVPLGDGVATVRNSAFVVDSTGKLLGSYDKIHLVPFGETSTWLLPRALQRRLGVPDDYSAGDTPTLLDIGGMHAGVLICWEGIYASAARVLVNAGAELLVNLSNDDWFDGHAAVEQHLHATLLRAVETRRFLLRATNSGVTAIVDPRGFVVASAPPGAATVVAGHVTRISGLTPYVRAGDVFAWACVLAALGALILPRAPASRSR
jgi:apolipoprotein N-acyltransferase